MEYTNAHGVKFAQYIEGRIWVTDITFENYSFRYNNSMDYYPHLETLTPEQFKKFASKNVFVTDNDFTNEKQNNIIEQLLELEKKGLEPIINDINYINEVKKIIYEGKEITEEEYKKIIDKDLDMDIIKKGKIVKKNETVEEPVEPKKKTTRKTTKKK